MGTLGTLHVIKLCKLAVPEEGVATTAVDSLDVHAESHNNLVVAVGTGVVLHPYFNCLVRDLDHLEVVLHLFLEKLMVQNHHSTLLDSTENIVVAAPSQVKDWLLSCMDRWEGLPTLVVDGTVGCHHLALPHNDETVFGATTKDAFLWVVRNRVDFVIEELALEGRFVYG